MGLWNSIRTAVLGVDLEEVQATSDRTDAALAVENQKDYAPGGVVYNQIVEDRGIEAANDTYDTVQQHQADQHVDVEAEVGQAFQEGLQEGADNLRGAIAAPFKLTWRIIPWQVIVLGIVGGIAYLFIFMGGPRLLKNFLPRKLR